MQRDNDVRRRPYLQRARADASTALRERILDELFKALTVEDYDRITLDDLARNASTTRQTVLRLFGSKDGALTELLDRTDSTVADRRLHTYGCDLTLLAKTTIADLEIVGNFVLQLLRQEKQIPSIAQTFARNRKEHIATLRENLGPLLDRLDTDESEAALLQARAVTDTLFWHLMRRDMALNPADAESLLLNLLEKIFAKALMA